MGLLFTLIAALKIPFVEFFHNVDARKRFFMTKSLQKICKLHFERVSANIFLAGRYSRKRHKRTAAATAVYAFTSPQLEIYAR